MAKTIHRREYRVLIDELRRVRERAGMTQTQLARVMRKRQTWISDVEVGTRRLDVLELRDLCEALGVNFSNFVKRVDRALRAANQR